MNIELTRKLSGVIELLMESSSRLNLAKPEKYWYPLSMATYGVDEILEAIDSMVTFRTSMWEKTLEFERQFSKFQGCVESVMINSGSSADLLSCFYYRDRYFKQNEHRCEVLVPAVTWPTQIWSAMMAGMKVRLVDVDPATLNISIDDLERKITDRTGAIFLVHLMGNPCDLDRISEIAKKRDVLIIEDCCEAMGAEWKGKKVGNFGLAGTFSFFFSHHITTMEGGMICCSSAEMAEELRILRAHGWLRNVRSNRYDLSQYEIDSRYAFVNWGFNLRPTELQAGFGLRQLEKAPQFAERRELLATRFFEFIDKSPFLSRPKVSDGGKPCWFALPLMVSEGAPFQRAELTEYLETIGVETRPIVAGSVTRHPVGQRFVELADSPLPGALDVHRRGFYVGLSPIMTESDIDKLIGYFEQFLASHK